MEQRLHAHHFSYFVIAARSQKLPMTSLSLIMSLRLVDDDQGHRSITSGWEEF